MIWNHLILERDIWKQRSLQAEHREYWKGFQPFSLLTGPSPFRPSTGQSTLPQNHHSGHSNNTMSQRVIRSRMLSEKEFSSSDWQNAATKPSTSWVVSFSLSSPIRCLFEKSRNETPYKQGKEGHFLVWILQRQTLYEAICRPLWDLWPSLLGLHSMEAPYARRKRWVLSPLSFPSFNSSPNLRDLLRIVKILSKMYVSPSTTHCSSLRLFTEEATYPNVPKKPFWTS